MQINKINVDENLRTTTFNTELDEYIFYFEDDYDFYVNHCIDPHWHPNFEIALILEGRVLFSLNGINHVLEKGEAILINSNVLHYMSGIWDNAYPKVFTIDFSTKFLSSQRDSKLYRSYIAPFLYSNSYISTHFQLEIPWHREIIQILSIIEKAYRKKDFTFDLVAHTNLCQLWTCLARHIDELPLRAKLPRYIGRNSVANNRIKQILEFIHTHISESLTINDLARSASISKTECFRLFQKILHKTPMTYIQEYRLEEAMALLATTDRPISDICYSCGFNSQSYFGKCFREKTGMTPQVYRSKNASRSAGKSQ